MLRLFEIHILASALLKAILCIKTYDTKAGRTQMYDDNSLMKTLRVLYEAGAPLDFEQIYDKSGLTTASVTRQLRKGERLGFVKKIIEETQDARARLKHLWKITQKGKRIKNLCAET